MEESGVTVRELLERTFSTLTERHSPSTVFFQRKALAAINRDDGMCRTRRGYMGYETVGIFSFNKRRWAIGRGEVEGMHYLIDGYDSDLRALEYDREIPDETRIIEMLWQSVNFRDSLIVGGSDGSLAYANYGRFKNGFERECFLSRVNDFALNVPTTMGSKIKYKPECVEFLADCIETALEESS